MTDPEDDAPESDEAGGSPVDTPEAAGEPSPDTADGAGWTSPDTAEAAGTTAADAADERPSGPLGWIRWFFTTERGAVVYVRDVVTSVAAVLFIGLILFAISGLWPPMVAVESESMNPNMDRGDLVFIMDNERFTPDEAPTHEGQSTGVVPADTAAETDRTKFNAHGDVIVFTPDGDELRTPIIHRAMLWVEADEDWYDRADERFVGSADSCEELSDCPAPYDGFVTLGDNNGQYDQVGNRQISSLVHPEWVVGTAEVRVPYLGNIRLWFSGLSTAPSPDVASETMNQEASPSTVGPSVTTQPAAASNSTQPPTGSPSHANGLTA